MRITKDIIYSEPEGYFPKELRKKHGVGEYAGKKNAGNKKTKTKTSKKK